MKYVIIVILRFAFVIVLIPIVLILVLLIALGRYLWDFNTDQFRYLSDVVMGDFETQSEPVRSGEKYWVYKNAFDYIIMRKTWRVKP